MKPDNMLFTLGMRDGTKRLCISDFGLSYSMPEKHVLFFGATRGTPAYLPPEALNAEVPPYRHPRSDVFSAALIVLFWIIGEDPVSLPNGSYDLTAAQGVLTPTALDTVRQMLSIEPMQRPSFGHLGFLDPLRFDNIEPASRFCDIVREHLEAGPTRIAGLPFVNHLANPQPASRTLKTRIL